MPMTASSPRSTISCTRRAMIASPRAGSQPFRAGDGLGDITEAQCKGEGKNIAGLDKLRAILQAARRAVTEYHFQHDRILSFAQLRAAA